MSERRELPDGWQWVSLSDICEINPRRPSNLVRADDEPTTFIPMAAVDEVSGTIIGAEEKPFSEVKKGYTFFCEGDVLFAKITPCMENGKHSIAYSLLDGIGFGTTEFHVIRPTTKVIAEWVHFFLRQPSILAQAAENFTGSVGQQRVPTEFLIRLEIPLPPTITEQRRIAARIEAYMAEISAARDAAEAELAAAEELAAAYLREVFDSDEARGWQVKSIGEFAAVTGGIQKQPSRSPLNFHRPYLTVRNVQRGRLDLSRIENFEISPAELERYRLQAGDVLIVEGNGSLEHIGRCAMFHNEIDDCIHQNHIIRVRVDLNQANPYFVTLYLNSEGGKAQMVDKARTSSGLYTLSVGKVQSLEIALPDPNQQQRIVEQVQPHILEANQLLLAIQERLEKLGALPSAILEQAFNGEL